MFDKSNVRIGFSEKYGVRKPPIRERMLRIHEVRGLNPLSPQKENAY